MTKIRYHFGVKDESKVARASVRNLRISWKNSVMIAKTIRRMPLKKARRILNEIVTLKRPLKYTKFYDSMTHKAGMMAGRYPVNAAKEFIKLLDNVENNADEKGLDVDKLMILNISANKSGARIPRGRRMFGKREAKSASIQITVMEKKGREKEEKKEAKKETKTEETKKTGKKVVKKERKAEKAKKQVVKKTKGGNKR